MASRPSYQLGHGGVVLRASSASIATTASTSLRSQASAKQLTMWRSSLSPSAAASPAACGPVRAARSPCGPAVAHCRRRPASSRASRRSPEPRSRGRLGTWLQVAAYVGGAAASSQAHLQDILASHIRVVDRMEIQLDAQPIPLVGGPQRRRADGIYGRWSIAIVHECPVRRRHTFRQGLIAGSLHQSPDGHGPRYCCAEFGEAEPGEVSSG
jgi:hypothetical protein